MQCDECGVDIPAGKELRKGFFRKKTLCSECGGKSFSMDVPMG